MREKKLMKFYEGDRVILDQDIMVSPGLSGRTYSILHRGPQGTVTAVDAGLVKVDFPVFHLELKNGLWFVDTENQPSGPYRAYPPVSALRRVSLSCPEGQSFTIEKDNGDGTFLVRKTS